MNRFAPILLCTALAACASTPSELAPLSTLEARPVQEVRSRTIDAVAVMTEAAEAYQKGEFAVSYDLYQTVLMHHADLNQALLGYGNAALALGHKVEAYKVFVNIIPETLDDEQKLDLMSGLALLSINSDSREDEESHLKTALTYSPHDPRLWNALGRYYDQNEQWVESAESYVRALSTGQSGASVINNLGMSLMMQARYDEAAKKFEQASALKPDIHVYDNNRRLVLVLKEEYKSAFSDLTLERQSHLLNDAGYIVMAQGQTELARRLFNKAIDASPVYHAKAAENLRLLARQNALP